MTHAAHALLASLRSLSAQEQLPLTLETLVAESEALRLDVPVYACLFPQGTVRRLMPADRVFRSHSATSPESKALVFAGAAVEDARSGTRTVVKTQFFGWQVRRVRELEMRPIYCELDFLPLPTTEVSRPYTTHEAREEAWRVMGRIVRRYSPVTTYVHTNIEVAEIVPHRMRIVYEKKQDLLLIALECHPNHTPDAASAYVANHRWVGSLCVDSRWLHKPPTSVADPPCRMHFPSLRLEDDAEVQPPSKKRRTVVLSQSDAAGLANLVDACFQRITAHEHLYGVRVTEHGLEPGPSIMVCPGPYGFRDLPAAFLFAPTALAVEVCKTQYGTVPGTLMVVLDLRIATAADLDQCFAYGKPVIVILLNTQREGSVRLSRGTSPLRPLLDRAYRDPLFRGIVFCFDDSECAPSALGTAWLWVLLGAMLGLPEGDMFSPHTLYLPRLFELCPPTVVGADPIAWCASHPARGTCPQLPKLTVSDTSTLRQLHDAVVTATANTAARFTTTRPIVVMHMADWKPVGLYNYKDKDVPWRLPHAWVITQTAEQLWKLQQRSSSRITGLVLCQRAAGVYHPLSTVLSTLIWRHRPDYLLHANIKHHALL